MNPGRPDPDDLGPLVEAARGGDRGAFEELVRRTYRDTYALAYRCTADEEDARDVVQETYLRAWRGLRRFRGEAQFTTWLYRITANTASSHRSRRARQRGAALEDHDVVDADVAHQPAGVAEHSAELGRLGAALGELTPRLRHVVVLKDVYDLPHEAIAAELGISVTAAKVRLHRGRRQLRDLLDAPPHRQRRRGSA